MSKCKSCGADIVWMKTRSMTSMPVDAMDENGVRVNTEKFFDPQTMVSHFATCPDAARFRKKKVGKP